MGTIIELRNVHKNFGELKVLNGASLTIDEGEIVAIIGPSGSGKSTLIRCINGLENIQSGEILVRNCLINTQTLESNKIRRKIGMVFQNFNLFPHYTALENIVLPCITVNKMNENNAMELGMSLLHKVRLEDKMNSYPASLSGGQKQRIAIARALAMEPDIMLFDEPTSALDPELAYEVLDTMAGLVHNGLTMVIVTHQINFVKTIAHRLFFLDEGEICVQGKPDEILNNPENDRLNKFLMRLKQSL